MLQRYHDQLVISADDLADLIKTMSETCEKSKIDPQSPFCYPFQINERERSITMTIH